MFSLKALILHVLFFVIGWLLARWLWSKKQSEMSHHAANTHSDRSSAATAGASSASATTTASASAEIKDEVVSATTTESTPVVSKSSSASRSSKAKSEKTSDDAAIAPLADIKPSAPSAAQEKIEDVVEDAAVSATPELLKAPRDGEADDLKKIKGVGKKIEEKLNGFGVYHFDQIANWSDEQVKWIGGELAFAGRIERENWIDQANVLASGGDTEFSRRVEKGKVSSSKS